MNNDDELVNDLVTKYIGSAKMHGEATETGQFELANRCHDEVIDAYLALERMGEKGIKGLMIALDHRDAAVRLWAATHLLKTHSELAEVTLSEVANNIGLVGFSAKVTLDEWRKGTLVLPPYPTRE